MNHGDARYKSKAFRCRCDVCREDHRRVEAEAGLARRAFVAQNGLPSHVEHGETAYRNWGCRCQVCLDAASESTIRRRWRRALANRTACSFDRCTNIPKQDGLCKQHAHQKATGQTLRALKRGEGRKSVGWVTERGYRKISDATHPNAHKNGSLYEHIAVMTEMLGRPLVEGENVHHKNGVKTDNRPENLELWVSSQPSGQRPEDLVSWAWEIIRRYDSQEGAA